MAAKKRMKDIKAEAIAKHGNRAYILQKGRETIESWQAALDAPVDEYAEALCEQHQKEIQDLYKAQWQNIRKSRGWT